MELIDARQPVDLSTIAVAPKVLGEGSFGCVLKSADGRWAIKVQDGGVSEICAYESGLQNQLASAVENAAVAKVYTYGVDVPSIPVPWRNALMTGGCAKASAWAQRGWSGRFCITVMDFLPGSAPRNLEPRNVPLFCFALLYTVIQGYEKMQFQHLDIKTANIILTPQPRGTETYTVCSAKSKWTFRGINAVPRLVDFGLSTTTRMPSSIDPLKNKGATLMITPFEVVVARIQPKNGVAREFMYTLNKRYHWSYDLFSIGMTILEATLSPPNDTFGMRLLMDAVPYTNGWLTRYGYQLNQPDAVHPGMVLLYMYNLCIIQHLLGNGSYPSPTDASYDAYYPPGTVGWDLLRSPQSLQIIDYVVAKASPMYADDMARFRQQYGAEGISMVASLMHWHPEKRNRRVLMHPFFAPYRKASDCNTGVEKDHIQTLYHQTSPEAAESIIASQTFRLGKQGMVGGGIYFAASVTDTDRKAETKGVILEAQVWLGKTKTITRPDYTMNLDRLTREGYNSVFIMTNSGPEYVVYDARQVRNVRYATGQDVLNRELTLVYPGLKVAKVLMLAASKDKKTLYLGRDARTRTYRLFGGTHDRKRSRGDNARHEWCEEFGAFLRGPDILCNPPTFEELKMQPKIFQGGKVAKGGPPQTNMVILMSIVNNIDTDAWNRNNQAVRAKAGVPEDYKEMDQLKAFSVSELMAVALATPPGRAASKGNEYSISADVLQALRDFRKQKIL